MSLRQQLRRLKGVANHVSALSHRLRAATAATADQVPVNIVIEPADWAIRWYGEFIASEANRLRPRIARVTTNPAEVTQGVIEFGSQYQCVDWCQYLSPQCRVVSTFFHGKPEDGDEAKQHIDQFLKITPRLDRIICSASIVRDRLLSWGIPADKLVHIPIGCETNRFVPPSEEQRVAARCRFAIPDDAVVVGSFQKDGQGWGEGHEPKPIKGPDIFLEAVRRLKRDINLFVMLTGPARGFVKSGLERLGIPFVHHFAEDRDDLARCYHALDLYLVTSREEGGPMALMESMASHVPVVSTPVGMAPDLLAAPGTGRLVDAPDPEQIAAAALAVLRLPDPDLTKMKTAARTVVGVADWSVVARRQLDEVWSPLLTRQA